MQLRHQGFTIIELLVSATLLIIIIGIVLQITDQTSQIWRSSNARIQAFQEARGGFESMTRKLSQATLNTYYDYYDSAFKSRSSLTTQAALANFVPASYDRASDLHFICGQATTLIPSIITQTQAVFFQAPLGYSAPDPGVTIDPYARLENALNASGYFLQFDPAIAVAIPDFVQPDWPGYRERYRFRLMEMIQPTDELAIYANASVTDWFVTKIAGNSRILAENVIALALLPKLPTQEDDPSKDGKGVSIAPNYNYNSRVPVHSNDTLTGFPQDDFKAFPVKPPAPPPNDFNEASRHHQLPPLMKVVMIVIDEASASRLQGTSTTVPDAINLSSGPGNTLFTDAVNLDADIATVEDICNAKPGNLTGNTQPLTYRVFTTDLIMREAKWSKD